MSNQSRKKVKVLNLITVKEIRSVEESRLYDITELKICLNQGGVKEHDAKFIARVLDSLKVTDDLYIDLRGNSLGDDSIKSIMSSVGKLTNLLHLKIYLSDNKISDISVIHLFNEFKN